MRGIKMRDASTEEKKGSLERLLKFDQFCPVIRFAQPKRLKRCTSFASKRSRPVICNSPTV